VSADRAGGSRARDPELACYLLPPRSDGGLEIAGLSRRFRWRGAAALAAGALAAVGLAEQGRRRAGGRAVFPAVCSWLAPVWLAERALCSWLSLGCRIRGGVAGHRLRRAATPAADLGDLAACRSVVGTEPDPDVRAVAERLEC
jgi:hypothetical protein